MSLTSAAICACSAPAGPVSAKEKIKNAAIALLLFDVNIITAEDLEIQIAQLELNESTQLICVGNKIDLLKEKNVEELFKVRNPIFISSKNLLHIDKLKSKLSSMTAAVFFTSALLSLSILYSCSANIFSVDDDVKMGKEEYILVKEEDVLATVK